MLGKRPLQPDPEEEAALQQAVASQIKRRRRSTNTTGAKVTLQERRAFDRATIEKIIKDNKPILKRWTDILEACLRGKVPQPFLRMQSIDDFIDGFQLFCPPGFTVRSLERLLRDKGLEITRP